jgi:hypothetical protein
MRPPVKHPQRLTRIIYVLGLAVDAPVKEDDSVGGDDQRVVVLMRDFRALMPRGIQRELRRLRLGEHIGVFGRTVFAGVNRREMKAQVAQAFAAARRA